jgi:uncharacterized protein (TIGR02301 family)
MRRSCLIALAWLFSFAAFGPQSQAQPAPDPYPVESLAHVLGELHYIAFACEGRGSQSWRHAMVELLEHEAPTRGGYRQRLIDNFNAGFRRQERRRIRCGAESELERTRLARQGRTLSEQLRRSYIE